MLQCIKKTRVFILCWVFFAGGFVSAKDLSVLFIGNSYTYFPGEESDPGLPKIVKKIAESIAPGLSLSYQFHTPGGYSFERHYTHSKSLALMSESYDAVILQGRSNESLELTPWFHEQGVSDVQSFSEYLPKVLQLVLQKNSKVTLFVNWGWHPKNSFLQEGHPGLRFPKDSPKAGEKWCGENLLEFQDRINESYRLHTNGQPVRLSFVGDAWLKLQFQQLATMDELYVENDWSHPSLLGSFVTALVLVRDALDLEIRWNQYFPPGVDPKRGRRIAAFLGRKNANPHIPPGAYCADFRDPSGNLVSLYEDTTR